MDNAKQQMIMDKLTKVCTCRAVSRLTIKEAIREGALTVEEVIEKTGACKGSCKGSRCRYKIEQLIEENK